jgi:hypothetical protein
MTKFLMLAVLMMAVWGGMTAAYLAVPSAAYADCAGSCN